MKIGQEREKQEGQLEDTKSRDTKSAQESSQSEDKAGTNVENPITLVEDTVLIDDGAEKNDDSHDFEIVENVDGTQMGMVVTVVKQIKKMKNYWFCELCLLIIPSQVHVSDLASKFTYSRRKSRQ